MDYRLDKLIGRAPLPGDEVAFDRVARMFERARKVQPAAKKAVVKKAVAKKARLGAVKRVPGTIGRKVPA